MPVDVVIKGYKFEELDNKAKDRVRSHYREHWLDYAWWDYLYDDLIEDMAEKGVCIAAREDIRFRGFSSQGDGASFTATIDMKKFVMAHDIEKDHPLLFMHIINGEDVMNMRLVRNSFHYEHEYTVSGEWDITLACDENGDMPVPAELFRELAEDITERCRGYMRAFYRTLEKQYEYECSDEAMTDAFEANEVLFTEGGKVI